MRQGSIKPMHLLRSVFWNTREHRLRAFWRLAGQICMFLVGVFSLQIIVGIAAAGLLVLQGKLTTAQLSNPNLAQSIQRMVVEDPVIMMLASLATFLSMLGSVWLAGRLLDRRPFADFGFHLNGNWWLDFGFGLCLGAILMVGIFLVEFALGWVTITGLFASRDPGVSFPLAILPPLITFLAVGFYEELFSRGYQLHNMAEGLNWPAISPRGAIVMATLLSSAIFGTLHLSNPNASLVSTVNLFLAGAILLSLGYILTGELAISIGAHISWNFFQGNVFGFPVSGGNFHSATFIQIQQSGPDLWTGGPFGPEAGLVGLGAVLLGGLLIVLWVRWHYGHVALHRSLAEAPLRPQKQNRPSA